MTHHNTISKFRSLIIKTCLVCILTIPSCHGDYDCLCSYEVEKAIYPVPDKQATPIGYMYEFDCKEHLMSLDTGNFAAIAFEKQVLCKWCCSLVCVIRLQIDRRPYVDSVAPGQLAQLHRLIGELRCPLICRIRLH